MTSAHNISDTIRDAVFGEASVRVINSMEAGLAVTDLL
jgi:hypothetical protein